MANKRVRFHKQYRINIKGRSNKWPFEEETQAVQRFEDILTAFIQAFSNLHPGAKVRAEVQDL